MKTRTNNIRLLKIASAIIIVGIVFYPRPWVVGVFRVDPLAQVKLPIVNNIPVSVSS